MDKHISQIVELLLQYFWEFNLRYFWAEGSFTLCDTEPNPGRGHMAFTICPILCFWEMRPTTVIGWWDVHSVESQEEMKRLGKGKVARWKDFDPLKIPSVQWQMSVSTWNSPHRLWEAESIKWHLISSGNKQKLSGKMSMSGRKRLIWQNKACAHKQTPLFTGIRRRKWYSGGLYNRRNIFNKPDNTAEWSLRTYWKSCHV